jgi:BlaI family penicillinase repressor
MEQPAVTLSPSEWAVMEALWENPKTLMELVRELGKSQNWAKSTVTTMVRRMEEKGLLTYRRQGRAKLFSPTVTRETVAMGETFSLLERAYRGSVGLMFSAMTKKQALSAAEIQELRDILRQAEEESL